MALDQAGYRWRLDDGDEDGATWMEDQNTNIQRWRNSNVRLRMLVDATGNPDAAQFRLEYRKKGTTQWYVVGTGAPSDLPSASPSVSPTPSPSSSLSPSRSATKSPSHSISHTPSKTPSHTPSKTPSHTPSHTPSPSASPSGGASYPDIDFYWGCESATAEKSAGDNTATYNSGAVISSAQHAVGSNSLSIPSTFDFAEFTVSSSDILSHISGRIGFYLWVTTFEAGDSLFHLRYDDTNAIWGYLSGTDELQLYYRRGGGASSSAWSDGGNITTGSWFFVEFSWNVVGTNPNLAIYVNGTLRGTGMDDLTEVWAGTPTALRLGFYGTNSGSVIFIDQVLCSSLYTRDLNALKGGTSFPD